MTEDKGKDDRLFNCAQKHEHDYVISRYTADKRARVETFLIQACKDNTISNSSHKKVYQLIKDKLGFAIPVNM